MQTHQDLIHWFFDRTNRLIRIVGDDRNEDYFQWFCTEPLMKPVSERWECYKQIRLRDNESRNRTIGLGLQRFNVGLNGLLNIYWKARVDLPKLRFAGLEEDVVLMVPKVLEAVRAWNVNDGCRWEYCYVSDPPVPGEVEYIREALESSDEKFPLQAKIADELIKMLGDARSIFSRCPIADDAFSELESVSWGMSCWFWDHEVGRDVWPESVGDVELLRPWLKADFDGPVPTFADDELQQLAQRHSSLVAGALLHGQNGKPVSGPEHDDKLRSLSKNELMSELGKIIDTNKVKHWKADELRSMILERNPGRTTAVKSIEKNLVYTTLLEIQGRNRARKIDPDVLNAVVSQSQREHAAENGVRVRGNQIKSRD
jgi:hypothetical protein